MRESPSVEIMEQLRKKQADIAYSDPFVPTFPKMREHHFDLKSVTLTEDSLKNFDCVILATNHDDFDYDLIHKHSQLIVDTRGVYRGKNGKVVKA